MREWALFPDPVFYSGLFIRKIMLCRRESGETCVFLYPGEGDVISSFDERYPSLCDALDVWDSRKHTAWLLLDDPLPGCQEDAFLPLRVKGRNEGKPEWGRYEVLRDGEWTPYKV